MRRLGFHKQREAFEDDRERDADHLDHGLSTVRITKTRLQQTPGYEAARRLRILSRSAPPSGNHPAAASPS